MIQNTRKELAFAGKSQHPTIPTNKKPKEYMSREPHPLLFAFHQPPVNNNHSASPIPSNDKSQSTPKDGSLKQTAYQKWNGNRSMGYGRKPEIRSWSRESIERESRAIPSGV
jgi:hypothetical protein